MIVVFDTNVIISALLSPAGAPAEIVRRWEAGEFDVVTSPPLINELRRALNYERVRTHLKFSNEESDTFLKRLRTTALIVEPEITVKAVKDDPDDNRVIECALAGGAAYIVSGNSHLLELKECEQIVILNPVGFLTALNLRGY
jgi:putative PIN family toxin of toxin-antitoxin system